MQSSIVLLNFTFSALLGPVFGFILQKVSGGAEQMSLEHYQTSFVLMVFGVAIAIVLRFLLKETGPAAGKATPINIQDTKEPL